MITGWLMFFLVVGAAASVLLSSWRRRINLAELGSVSEHWLAEQRSNDRYYSER